MGSPRVSLCLIARNEEELLPGCLASVRGAVDEIVLVDTGSTDRTRELAREAGALVLTRPWDDDFAAPRNLAVERASGDFVLQLDADERLHAGAGAALRAALPGATFDVGFVRLHNASRLDAPPAEVVRGALRHGEPHLLPRVLRRTSDLRYVGAIHESVTEWAVSRGSRFQRLDLDVVHLGYVQSLQLGREKKQRNRALLERRVLAEPDSIVPLSYLAAELVAAGEWDAAAEVAERGWALLDRQPPHRPVRRLLVSRAVAAVHRGELPKVHASVDAAEAKEGYNPDFDHLRGYAWELEGGALPPADPRRAALLEKAAAAFGRALAAVRQGGFVQVMITGEPEALVRLGATFQQAGAHGRAAQAYAEARAAGGAERLRLPEAEARVAAGEPGAALALLQPLLTAGEDAEAWAMAARAALALGAGHDAALFLARAKALAAKRA